MPLNHPVRKARQDHHRADPGFLHHCGFRQGTGSSKGRRFWWPGQAPKG